MTENRINRTFVVMSPTNDERVELRVPVEDLERWRATAAVENLSVSEWIRQRCNEVAVDQETIDLVKRKLAERDAARARMRIPLASTRPPAHRNVSFDRDHFVELLREGWSSGKPLAHNWQRDAFPGKTVSIHAWADARGINWGGPQGYPVQEAQRIERGHTNSRIRAFQEPRGKKRLMFALSQIENADAFQAATEIAEAAGFELLTP